MTRWVTGILVSGVALLSLSACTQIGKMPHDMEAVIRGAATKADHEALAAHYEQEAKALQDQAAEHLRMAQTYALSSWGKARTTLGQHCNVLAAKYQEAAKENLALAKEHHEFAEGASE